MAKINIPDPSVGKYAEGLLWLLTNEKDYHRVLQGLEELLHRAKGFRWKTIQKNPSFQKL